MTFTANSATTGIAGAVESQWTDSTFIEHGDRYNFAYTLRDELVVENGEHVLYHYRDVSYDVDGHVRDWMLLNVDGTASGPHTVQFNVTATLDTTQTARLVDSGDLSFQVFLSLNGGYDPGAAGQPGAPVFSDISSGLPVALTTEPTWYPEDRHFNANASGVFAAPRDLVTYEYAYLIEAGADLVSEQAAFMIHGPGYDAGVRTLSYSEFLGSEVIPVPEPRTWAMLLAGVAVLALARRPRTAVFKYVAGP
ncbi:PEP-CTERM sorting domain-containing protein [Massilia sp. METH4]|uniref:PEP-CTERM sorting domain-containing protein n=1 Tax=Massilia sp. METH4 TaxID=3123041 RepID=UPI0030CD3691